MCFKCYQLVTSINSCPYFILKTEAQTCYWWTDLRTKRADFFLKVVKYIYKYKEKTNVKVLIKILI